MARKIALVTLISAQAAALLVAGALTFYYSHSLMLWLIHMVGEERALGADNVIRPGDGSTLLTNPFAMMSWAVPFWLLSLAQISAAFTLIGLGTRVLRPGRSPRKPGELEEL